MVDIDQQIGSSVSPGHNSRDIFYLEGGVTSDVRLTTNDELVVEHPRSEYFRLFGRKSLVIPFEDFLAVNSKCSSFDNLDFKANHIATLLDVNLKGGEGGGLLRRNTFKSFKSQRIMDRTHEFEGIKNINVANTIVIDYVSKGSNNVWSRKSIQLMHESPDLVSRWLTCLNKIMEDVSRDRPQNLMVFVNPYGGKGQAVSIHTQVVQPLFESYGVTCDVIITERANHARDMLQTCNLDGIDGVVCVGGDGMFSELFNGLLIRSARADDIDLESEHAADLLSAANLKRPKIRVGVIPGGSTDAVALSMHGTADVETAVLHIVLGDRRLVDVTSVCSGGVLQRFSMAMVSYGYFGDLMKRSERYRWLGPKRYDLSGVLTFLNNKGYEGNLSFVEAIRQTAEGQPCKSGCGTCAAARRRESSGDEEGVLIAKALQGKYSVITAACMKCACRHTPRGVSPGAHLGDGLVDLILVAKTSRVNYFRYLYRTAYLRNSPFDLPFVQKYKVREFSFTPEPSTMNEHCNDTSVWNCDGEILHNPCVCIKVHCQVLPVFARGPEIPG